MQNGEFCIKHRPNNGNPNWKAYMADSKEITPLHVAGFFLKASEEGKGISNLQINKLAYLSHGWYLGNREKPLIITELPEAWKYGPVYRSIFNMFGRFGSKLIPSYMHRGVSVEPVDFAENTDFLKLVWNTYKDERPWDLVKTLHEPGSPWHVIWNSEDGHKGKNIPDELTKAYYLDKVQQIKMKKHGK